MGPPCDGSVRFRFLSAPFQAAAPGACPSRLLGWARLGHYLARCHGHHVLTTPTFRYHPSIVAQTSALSARLFGPRLSHCTGSLTKHGYRSPVPPQHSHRALSRVGRIIRLLCARARQLQGKYTIQNAPLIGRPSRPIYSAAGWTGVASWPRAWSALLPSVRTRALHETYSQLSAGLFKAVGAARYRSHDRNAFLRTTTRCLHGTRTGRIGIAPKRK